MPEARTPGRRLVAAPTAVLAVAAGSCAAYDASPPPLADWVILPYAACLGLAPSLLFPLLRRAGASLPASLAGGLTVYAAWLGKEFFELSAVYPLGETLYYALNPVSFGLLLASFLQMSLVECVLRARQRRPAWGPAAALAAILCVGGLTALAARGNGGREIFYAYVALHARLFGGE